VGNSKYSAHCVAKTRKMACTESQKLGLQCYCCFYKYSLLFEVPDFFIQKFTVCNPTEISIPKLWIMLFLSCIVLHCTNNRNYVSQVKYLSIDNCHSSTQLYTTLVSMVSRQVIHLVDFCQNRVL